MFSGVPTGPQAIEGASHLLHAVGRANWSRLQRWMGSPEAGTILQGVLNARPEYIAKLIADPPPIEGVRLKAELLGAEDRLGEVELVPNATGWMFPDIPLERYGEVLEGFGVTQLANRQSGERGLWPGVYPALICRGDKKGKATCNDPIGIASKRRIRENETSPPHHGCGALGFVQILDLIVDLAVRATLLGRDIRQFIAARLQLPMGNGSHPVGYEVHNLYGDGSLGLSANVKFCKSCVISGT